MSPGAIQAIAAVATFFAALLAVWAAFRAPRMAAEFAESLRVKNAALDENRRLKLWIFSTLMQHRASILAPESIAALNLIDVVFLDSSDVRNARRDFMVAAEANPFVPQSVIERFIGLIHCIARDMGLTDKISIADIRSVYFPRDMGERAELELLERQERLNALRGKGRPTGPA